MRARLLLLCLAMLVSGGTARANYVIDEQRKPDPAFAKFFLNRIDSWFRGHVFDYVPTLTPAEKKFVTDYLADPRSLGELKGSGFIRTYSYSYSARNGKLAYGPFRFVRPTPTKEDQLAFASLLKAEGIPGDTGDVIGVGFTGAPAEIEVIRLAQALPPQLAARNKKSDPLKDLVTVSLYRARKLVSVSAVERGVKPTLHCPASPLFSQVDRVTAADDQYFAFHSSTFEDEALSMEGRKLVHQIELGLQLEPGVIDYHSQTDYRLAYP